MLVPSASRTTRSPSGLQPHHHEIGAVTAVAVVLAGGQKGGWQRQLPAPTIYRCQPDHLLFALSPIRAGRSRLGRVPVGMRRSQFVSSPRPKQCVPVDEIAVLCDRGSERRVKVPG
jgi:hypothetical protein